MTDAPLPSSSELADLRRDAIELREWKAAVLGKCKASDGFETMPWGGDKEGWGFVHYFIGHLETRALHAETVLAEQSPPQAQAGETKLGSSEPLGPHYDGTTMDNQQLHGTTRRNQTVVTAGETATEPHRLDPFPFRGTDAGLFNAAVIIDPSIQLSTTPESMREEALRKAKEIAGACGVAQASHDPCPYEDGKSCVLEDGSIGPCLCVNPVAQEVRETCIDCGKCDPCDDDCPNFIEPGIEHPANYRKALASPPAALPAGEEELARCLYEAEYDGEAYPWRDQPSDTQLTYRQQAQKVLRDFRVSALPSTTCATPVQAERVPKVRTSHHRNKEEAARLQALVDKRYVWPAGCHDPDSCARHFGCMYIQCPNMKKDGNDLAAEIRASVISSTDRHGPCQCCGETKDLKCGPSRFGAETWACADCWEPDGKLVPPARRGGEA